MTTQVEIRTPRGRRHTVILEGDRVDVGRSTACAIRVPFPALSAQHFRFTRVGDGWTVEDLGSRNGTRVDGRSLQPGEIVELQDGAKIEAGGVTFEVIVLSEAGTGFTLSESGTMLRQLVAESLSAQAGAYLQSRDGREVDVPDFAAQLAVDAFMVDRRGHGFWLTPRGAVRANGVEVPDGGVALQDGMQIEAERTWVFHDPLEAALARVDEVRGEVPEGRAPAREVAGLERALVWVGWTAMVLSAAALLLLFEIV